MHSPTLPPSHEMANRAGKSRTYMRSDLGHWFSACATVRNEIVHAGLVPPLVYDEPRYRYNGPLFHTGEA